MLNPSGLKPTLRQVAQAAGVSVATASVALRNRSRIAAATRARVQATAARLGYSINPLVSALLAHIRSTKSPRYQATLGYFETHSNRENWDRYECFRRYFEGARAHAETLGYRLERLGLLEEKCSPQRWGKILKARGIAGLIFHHVPDWLHPDFKIDFDFTPFASSSIDTRIRAPHLHHASVHYYWNLNKALLRLTELGYSRIGVNLSIPGNEWTRRLQLAALLQFQETLPRRQVVPPLHAHFLKPCRFQQWFKKYRPDVILTNTNEMPPGLLGLGLKIPEEIGFATMSKSEGFPDHAGIDEVLEFVSAAAVDLVIGQLHRNERGLPAVPRTMTIEGKWCPGTTVRKIS